MACKHILLANEQYVCTECRIELPYTYEHLALHTASLDKFYGRVPVEYAASLLFYAKAGKVQQLIHNLKYKNHPELSHFLGALYAAQLKSTPHLTEITSIIPVPLHKNKLRQRGYNQVDGFAQAMSESLKVPINDKLLIKTLKSTAQATKSRFQRDRKKQEEFDINPEHLTQKVNHFLLLDDILTTGNTLEACCKKLLEIPHTKVTILCLARSI